MTRLAGAFLGALLTAGLATAQQAVASSGQQCSVRQATDRASFAVYILASTVTACQTEVGRRHAVATTSE